MYPSPFRHKHRASKCRSRLEIITDPRVCEDIRNSFPDPQRMVEHQLQRFVYKHKMLSSTRSCLCMTCTISYSLHHFFLHSFGEYGGAVYNSNPREARVVQPLVLVSFQRVITRQCSKVQYGIMCGLPTLKDHTTGSHSCPRHDNTEPLPHEFQVKVQDINGNTSPPLRCQSLLTNMYMNLFHISSPTQELSSSSTSTTTSFQASYPLHSTSRDTK